MTRSTVRSPTAPEPDHVFDGRALLLAGLDRDHRMDRAAVEIPAQWRQVVPFLDQIPQRRGQGTYGVGHAFAEGGFRYFSGIEVTDAAGLPAELGTLRLPAQAYAAFVHSGHLSELPATLDAAWRGWLPHSGFEAAGPALHVERYGPGFDPVAGRGDIEVWLPIRKRGQAGEIA